MDYLKAALSKYPFLPFVALYQTDSLDRYVTSSNTGIAGIFTGLAISPHLPLDIIGVVKAYTTRYVCFCPSAPTYLSAGIRIEVDLLKPSLALDSAFVWELAVITGCTESVEALFQQKIPKKSVPSSRRLGESLASLQVDRDAVDG